MLLCVITDTRLFLFLLFNPIPPPRSFFPRCSVVITPSPASVSHLFFCVCKYQSRRLCTLAVPLERRPGQPFLMFSFLRCSRADWFLCWLRADDGTREGHKCVLRCEREQQTNSQWCSKKKWMTWSLILPRLRNQDFKIEHVSFDKIESFLLNTKKQHV